MKGKVIVGMSGGVDSSVAAYLLKEEGYEVAGVTMQVLPGQAEDSLSAQKDAARVCKELGIPHYVVDFRQEFERDVIGYFVREYAGGRTPNPCIACNRHVKWEALLHRCRGLGADFVATGHYARVARLSNGRYAVRVSVTDEKDQTYALYNLTQKQLARTKMPVGEYAKDEIRDIARRAGIMVADKPDSQEICFIPDQDYAGFIDRETGRTQEPGDFVAKDGTVLGRHKGITHYTVGQRKGLGLAMGKPVFVTEIRPEQNQVVIGSSEDVFGTSLYAGRLNFMSIAGLKEAREVVAKIRYNHQGAPCTLEPAGEDRALCQFQEPVRAITPGQAVVFYEGDIVVGGGTIL